MIRILVLLSLACSLHAATHPYIELDGESHTVISVNLDGAAVLADGRAVRLSRGKVPIQLKFDDNYSSSSVEATISNGPQLAIMDTLWTVNYQVTGALSQKVDSFGVLIRTNNKGEKMTIPFRIDLEEADEAVLFEVSINPLGGWSDILKTEPGNYFYECRLFAEGREILVQGDDKNVLLVDWDRFESKEDSKPEIVLPVVERVTNRKGQAQVVVEFVVDETGETRDVRIFSKTKRWYMEAPRKMIEMSRFYPVVKDGKPVPAKLKLPIAYSKN